MVYKLQSIGPLDLAPLASTRQFSSDAKLRAKEIKKIYEDVKKKIEKENLKYEEQANWQRKHVKFNVGNLVWIHRRKDRLPPSKHGKLKP